MIGRDGRIVIEVTQNGLGTVELAVLALHRAHLHGVCGLLLHLGIELVDHGSQRLIGLIERVHGAALIVGQGGQVLLFAAGLDGIQKRMELQAPVNKNLFLPGEVEGLGLEALPASLEEAVEVAQNSEFLKRVLPQELGRRYYAEALRRSEALKKAADPAEYERIHYFNAI